jgi:hypothetical protein
VHGLTDVVICIGLAIDQELVLGVIYNPFLDEMVMVPRVLMRLCAFVCVLVVAVAVWELFLLLPLEVFLLFLNHGLPAAAALAPVDSVR